MAEKRPSDAAFDFCASLSSLGTTGVIVGGTAMALHGIPRATIDLDILLPAERTAIENVAYAAERVGLSAPSASLTGFLKRPELLVGQCVTLTDSQRRELVDILFEKPETFSRLLERSESIADGPMAYRVVCLADLKEMKKVSGRAIDEADIRLIEERQERDGKDG